MQDLLLLALVVVVVLLVIVVVGCLLLVRAYVRRRNDMRRLAADVRADEIGALRPGHPARSIEIDDGSDRQAYPRTGPMSMHHQHLQHLQHRPRVQHGHIGAQPPLGVSTTTTTTITTTVTSSRTPSPDPPGPHQYQYQYHQPYQIASHVRQQPPNLSVGQPMGRRVGRPYDRHIQENVAATDNLYVNYEKARAIGTQQNLAATHEEYINQQRVTGAHADLYQTQHMFKKEKHAGKRNKGAKRQKLQKDGKIEKAEKVSGESNKKQGEDGQLRWHNLQKSLGEKSRKIARCLRRLLQDNKIDDPMMKKIIEKVGDSAITIKDVETLLNHEPKLVKEIKEKTLTFSEVMEARAKQTKDATKLINIYFRNQYAKDAVWRERILTRHFKRIVNRLNEQKTKRGRKVDLPLSASTYIGYDYKAKEILYIAPSMQHYLDNYRGKKKFTSRTICHFRYDTLRAVRTKLKDTIDVEKYVLYPEI